MKAKQFLTQLPLFVPLLWLLSFVKGNSQVLQCKEIINPVQIDASIYSHSAARAANDDTQYVLNIYFHIVRDDNGGAPAIAEDQIQDAVAMLNIAFNDFDIFFKCKGFDYIDNSALLSLDVNEFNSLENLPQYRNDALNLYCS